MKQAQVRLSLTSPGNQGCYSLFVSRCLHILKVLITRSIKLPKGILCLRANRPSDYRAGTPGLGVLLGAAELESDHDL